MMHRRTALKTGMLIALAAAFPVVSRSALAAVTPTDASRFVEGLAENAIATMAGKDLSDADRRERFRNLFVSAFDLPRIGQFVLARYWRSATPEQQQEFLKLFEELTVLTWARRFASYDGELVQTQGVSRDGDQGWLVDCQIVRRQGSPIPIQWRVRETDGGLRVVDLVVEGMSMALTHRSDYGAAMQANGGRFDLLLASIRTKIDQLRATG